MEHVPSSPKEPSDRTRIVNSLTKSELKAVLAHEFGHFFQKTMKVGGYIYHVNQVIFNLLFENDGYEKMIYKWGNISDYFSVFNFLAIKIVKGIQWLLGKLYVLVNRAYMGLSREMEFHADQIGALVAGSEPMAAALMLISLADSSLNAVYSFYDQKVKEHIISQNIYPEQFDIFREMGIAVQFIKVSIPIEQVQQNLINLKPIEERLKNGIKWLLDLEIMSEEITSENRESLNRFVGGNWNYFIGTADQDSQLSLLFESMNLYAHYL